MGAGKGATFRSRELFVWNYSGWLPYEADALFGGYIVEGAVAGNPLRQFGSDAYS